MRSIRAAALSLALAFLAAACADQPVPSAPDGPQASLATRCAAFDNASSDARGATGCAAAALPGIGTMDAGTGGTPFLNPDPHYVDITDLIDISELSNFSSYSSITDGDQTFWFLSSNVEKRVVPDNWATWSSPPYSETSTPHVLYNNATTNQIIGLSDHASVIGFEVEPNNFSDHTFTVEYYAGDVLLGQITRSAHGSYGARLFAFTAPGGLPVIDGIEITGTDNFSMARFRYADGLQPTGSAQDAFDGLHVMLDILLDDEELSESEYATLHRILESAESAADDGKFFRARFAVARFAAAAGELELPAYSMIYILYLVDEANSWLTLFGGGPPVG